jgi:hypothetical protein
MTQETMVAYKGFELSEIEALVVELPDRELMSLANANVALPINAGIALNALSDSSVAMAQATQSAPIMQSTAPLTLGR